MHSNEYMNAIEYIFQNFATAKVVCITAIIISSDLTDR